MSKTAAQLASLTPVLACAVLAGALPGCGGSGQDPSFQAGGPLGRTKAIGDAAATNDRRAIPDLIEALWSDDPAERMLSIRALESMTGQTLGYGFADEEQKRTEAADRWVSWWRADRAPTDPGQTGGIPQGSTGADGGL